MAPTPPAGELPRGAPASGGPPTFETSELSLDHRWRALTGHHPGRTIQHMMKNVVEVRDLVVVRGEREADLRESLEFARAHLAVPTP